jgi:hypothetical protein
VRYISRAPALPDNLSGGGVLSPVSKLYGSPRVISGDKRSDRKDTTGCSADMWGECTLTEVCFADTLGDCNLTELYLAGNRADRNGTADNCARSKDSYIDNRDNMDSCTCSLDSSTRSMGSSIHSMGSYS